jgi:hypothetical protein
MRAITTGQVYADIPLNGNIYDCNQIEVIQDPMKLEPIALSFSNRTASPVISRAVYKMFKTNETGNCPILADSLRIERVTNYKGETISKSSWSTYLRTTKSGDIEVTRSNLLVVKDSIYISASNALRRSQPILVETLNIFRYDNTPP